MARFFAAYVRLLRLLDWAIVLASIALGLGCFQLVRQLEVRSDFKEMLPEKYPSVRQLKAIEQRVRATASLLLLVGGEDWPAMRRFIDDFASRARAELPDIINRVDINAEEVRQFFDTNKYLYIDLPDLEEIQKRLKHHIDKEKLKVAGLYTEFHEEPFDISDIEEKYKQKTSAYEDYRDGYFTNRDASLAIVVLKPNIGATDVATAERLIGRVRGLVDSMQPSSYHQSLRYGFGGRYPKVIQEFRTVVGDILRTTLLCVGLIGAVVLIYFRRLRMGWLMAVAVGVGTMAALAIARLTIGYLTVQSAFLGSIIVGNGINYSIILLARYIEERRDRDASSSDALTTALTQTWGPTCIAALTAAVSFGALGLTQMRGFSHFGFIGGIGMPLCWLATYVFVPAWLHCSERCWPTRFAAASEPFGRLFSPIGVWVVRKSRTVIAWSIGATVIALGIAGWYLPRSLEYNFNRLRFKPAAPQETWEEWARSRADEVFGQSASPAVILADRPGQVEAICAAVDGRGPALIGEDGQPIYDACKSILTYVPKEQETKLARLAEIRDMLSGSTLKFLTDEQRKEVEKFRESFALQPIGVEDLPKTLVDNFAEMDGRVGLVVYVYPQPAADLWHGKALIQFADLVRRVDLPGGETIHSSGEAVIFADLLRAVVREGPRLTLYSFCLVLLLVFVNFRERLACAYVMGSLAVGIVWLVAALAMAGVRLNFLNFVALPISFGIGVDYAVNIFQRYRQDGPGSVAQVVRHMGGAVFLCSLTTMIGYSVLLISRNQALNSFGLAALLGELTCLAAALVSLPAGIALAESRANARS